MFIIFLYPTKQFKDKIDNEKEKKNREPNNFVVENSSSTRESKPILA